ncbi:SMI1/KNR4 family protein [Streptomyces sp. SP17BM10]|uniref:SMI1/KNR4 family protein n=1 Tax=Streptomyces sp. SP17BM10 TaxID=3002530 RepID=UPI002E7624CF|nr:SMI1/KNR4 family protein [Streptomyces sp. SP17BM10]MEE1783254.1 SMI1/KNR4 family protein [Streptomyces sp. SP17BM10]
MSDYLAEVFAMLGPGEQRFTSPDAWAELEAEIGTDFPEDYKAVVDAYAPMQINGHLYLSHPATERWNLGKKIRETSRVWAGLDWDREDWLEPEENIRVALDLQAVRFGTKDGLIPITSTDRGEYVFLAPLPDGTGRRICVVEHDGSWYEYRMSFSEWLYRYLAGEDMVGPNSSAFYPGPVRLEPLPMSPDDRPTPMYGPERGM